VFGDVSVLQHGGRRNAGVVADTCLRLARLPADALSQALADVPGARALLEDIAERQRIAAFLKLATPFAVLEAGARRRLAERVRVRAIRVGEVVVEQGAPGEACYLMRSGSVEIRVVSADSSRVVATLGPGALFGETAVLTGELRNASAVVVEAGELLELRRADLLSALSESGELEGRLATLTEQRSRPRRAEGVELHRRTTAEGETVAVLKDPRRGEYFQLSAGGLFLWNRLSGDLTLDELMLLWFAEFGRFAPRAVQETVNGLVQAGFAHSSRLPARPAVPALADKIARLVELHWTFEGLDPFFTRAHAAVRGLLHSRASWAVAAAVGGAGVLAFASDAPRFWRLATGASPATLLVVYPALAVSTLLHELGHALALKAFGRQVPRAGVGLYYLAPIAFVDTSDAWLEPPSRRLVVALAGIAVNLTLAGAASLLALALSDEGTVIALAAFATSSYAGVVANLNPLLRLDGYHALVDLLGRPGLRTRALAWAGRGLPAALRDRAELRAHRVELAYALGSLAYLAALAVAVWAATRGAVATLGWPAPMTAALPWLAGALATLPLAASALKELRGDAG
jgi:putative peptide zinc metalloprotease protein